MTQTTDDVRTPSADAPLWVFGYGSLLWNPGFDIAESHRAMLSGWHRSFCMASVHYRGTPQKPGLVLALDAASGGTCHGLALRAAPGTEVATHAYLRARELVTDAYVERWLPLCLDDGRQVTALTYVIDPAHEQYRGGLSLEDQAHTIASAAGQNGENADYLCNTAAHLREIGVEDAEMSWLADRVTRLRAPG